MQYRIGSLMIEAIDTYVRVSMLDGFTGQVTKTRVTTKELPTTIEVAELVCAMRGIQLGWLDSAHLQVCGRAVEDAMRNRTMLDL